MIIFLKLYIHSISDNKRKYLKEVAEIPYSIQRQYQSKYFLFNIQFSDHSTSNPQQEDEIWTQGGIQGLVDRADQDH